MKYKLTIAGNEVELTTAEARALYEELKTVFCATAPLREGPFVPARDYLPIPMRNRRPLNPREIICDRRLTNPQDAEVMRERHPLRGE